tara:strand:+ start:454 stop:1566 length:1113 start_codon:yes stop_codon:yes gene_type:complete
MNKIIVALLLISFIFFFFLGLFVGVYKIFPYSELDNIKNQFELNSEQISNQYSKPVNLEPMTTLYNIEDVKQKRNELIQFVWKTNELPNKLPEQIDKNISDERFIPLSNLEQIDKLTITMEHGLSSIVYVFYPENSNGKVVIYHQGHSGGFINGKSTIEKFVDDGFTVAAFSMPLIGLNNQPIVNIENIGSVKLLKHNQFVILESDEFSSMSYFFTPITVTINYLTDISNFKDFYMLGISGGGWTSTVYPALDTRITKSFSIAGSLPLSLRNIISDVGDYEQFNPEFYSIANYFDIYVMSSSGNNREHIQIFNQNDPCCFSGKDSSYLFDPLRNSISSFDSGVFEIIVDETHNEHKISNFAYDIIMKKLV